MTAACSSPSPSVPATFALPTVEIAATASCAGVGLGDATLNGDPADPRVAWLEIKGYPPRDLVFPPGYVARFTPRLEVLDASGRVVLRAGDKIDGACVVGGDRLLIGLP